MTCYYPLQGYLAKRLNKNGKREIVFNPNDGFRDKPIQVECGNCIGCRLEKSRQWAVRCFHEHQIKKYSCFLTLTYDNKNLPPGLSLDKTEVQKFIKRLRRKYPEKDLSVMYCGEYGEKFLRPHYHLCLFGMDFTHDREHYKPTDLGHNLYTSETLDKLWTKRGDKEKIGHAVIGDMSFQSAAYVARYVVKKVNGKEAPEQYGEICDMTTGELTLARQPEFGEASRNPALGKTWFEKYYKEVYPCDYVVVNKKRQKPPKYYDDLLEKVDNELYQKVKAKRVTSMKEQQRKKPEEFEQQRLATKAAIRSRKRQFLPRRFEKC